MQVLDKLTCQSQLANRLEACAGGQHTFRGGQTASDAPPAAVAVARGEPRNAERESTCEQRIVHNSDTYSLQAARKLS